MEINALMAEKDISLLIHLGGSPRLVWNVVVHAADIHDGVKAHLLVEHCLGYLERMRKILLDAAYKKVFYSWVHDNIIGFDIEFASKAPTEKGFIFF